MMQAKHKIKMLRKYLDYTERHIDNVERAWGVVQQKLKHMNVIYDDFLFAMTEQLIRKHDLSKFSCEEFVPYAEWFYGPYGKKYDIWDDGGAGEHLHKQAQEAFVSAWENHKCKNPHHWENWINLTEHFPNEKSCHLVSMVVDWVAMSMEIGDTAEEYYRKNKDRIDLPGWAEENLESIFVALRG